MSLVIDKKTFKNTSELKLARQHLSRIPEPRCYAEMPENLTSDQAVIVLQREVVALDLLHMPPTVQYTGTKNLVTCIYARIYNDEQELSVHVDSVIAPLNISAMLSHFRRKDNLNIMLIGGMPGEISSMIVDYLLKALIEAPELMTVTHQKLLDRNCAKDITKHVFMRDFIMRKASLLFKQLFDKELDISGMSKYPLSMFLESVAQNEPANAYGIEGSDRLKTSVFLVCKSFNFLNEYVKVENKAVLTEIMNKIRLTIKTENDFHLVMKSLFTHEVYDGLLKIFANVVYDVELSHFVVHIKTGDVFCIPILFDTPYEAYRHVFLHDHQGEKDLRAKRYFLAYDQFRAVMPVLSAEALREVHLFYKYLDHEMDLSIFIPERGYQFFGALSTIRKHDPEIKLTTMPCLIRYSDKRLLATCYHDSKIAEESLNLERLNEYLPKNIRFTAKVRRYPSQVIDALLPCDNWSDAFSYQRILKSNAVEAYIIYHEDFGLTLCVPGINVSHGERIGVSDKRPQVKQPWV